MCVCGNKLLCHVCHEQWNAESEVFCQGGKDGTKTRGELMHVCFRSVNSTMCARNTAVRIDYAVVVNNYTRNEAGKALMHGASNLVSECSLL